jgi:signal recognition particle subunit SEC65
MHTFMAKLLTDHEFQRFNELQQKQSAFTITSAEADELRDIVARAQQRRDDRASAMQTIESHIRKFDITPEELFSAEQIAEAARAFGLIPLAKKPRKPAEMKAPDDKADSAKLAEVKTADTKTMDVKAANAKPAERTADGAKAAEAKMVQAAPVAADIDDANTAGTNATDMQIAGTPHQPADATLFDADLADTSTQETQPA